MISSIRLKFKKKTKFKSEIKLIGDPKVQSECGQTMAWEKQARNS
jgi:hypothetical protein